MLSSSLSRRLADVLEAREEPFNRIVTRSVPSEFRTVVRECQADWFRCHITLLRGGTPDLFNLIARFCQAADAAGQRGPAYVLGLIEFETQTLRHFLVENCPEPGKTEIELTCPWHRLMNMPCWSGATGNRQKNSAAGNACCGP